MLYVLAITGGLVVGLLIRDVIDDLIDLQYTEDPERAKIEEFFAQPVLAPGDVRVGFDDVIEVYSGNHIWEPMASQLGNPENQP